MSSFFFSSYSISIPFSLIFFILVIKYSNLLSFSLLITTPIFSVFFNFSSFKFSSSSNSKNEFIFKLSSSIISIIDILYRSSFIYVFLLLSMFIA